MKIKQNHNRLFWPKTANAVIYDLGKMTLQALRWRPQNETGQALSYEESARVPFIVSWPGHTPRRVDTRHFVSASVDLLPTLCDYAGIETPKGLPGRSVLDLVENGGQAGWREDVVIECGHSRAVRSSRYKYTVFEGDALREMLIDMEKDPGEMTNLASERALASVLADHRRRLRRRVEELNDEFGRSLLSTVS